MHLFGEWLSLVVMPMARALLDVRPRATRSSIPASVSSFARRHTAAVAHSVWRRIGKIETLHDRADAAQLHVRRSRALPRRCGETLWRRPYRAGADVR